MSIDRKFTIDQLLEKFEGAKTVIHEYGSLPAEVVNFKLNPSTWSCVEVCKHLIRFNQIYLDEIDRALQKLDEIPVIKNQKSKFSPKWTIRKLAGHTEPPYKFGIKTIQRMSPENVQSDSAATFKRLLDIEDEFISLLNKAEIEKWNFDKIKGRHPIVKFYRMSFTDIIVLTDAHQRRHFWQIEQILKRIPESKNNS
jgi:hypothetical protein